MQKKPVHSTDVPSPAPLNSRAVQAQAGRVKSSIPYKGTEAPIQVATNGGFFGLDEIKPSELRHVLITGETGSGKTTSVMEPLMVGGLRYKIASSQGPLKAAAFVVDPKRELREIVERELSNQGELDRLVVLGHGQAVPRVRFFDPNSAIEEAEQLARLDVIGNNEDLKGGDQVYWHKAGRMMLSAALALEKAYRLKTKKSLFEKLADACCPRVQKVGGFWGALHAVFNLMAQGENQIQAVRQVLIPVLEEHGLANHPDATFLGAYERSGDHHVQFVYRFQQASTLLDVLRHPSVADVIDFDPFPEEDRDAFDVRKAIDAGMVLLLQPDETQEGNELARAIKAKVYEAVLTRQNMERPVLIFIDEFQRVITDDLLCGEARFLEVARSYRANCVMATQSVDALHYALGSTNRANAAVKTLITNTSTKFFFNVKDERTSDVVRKLIPIPHTGMHVVDCRTLAGLRVGEAYYFFANGKRGLDRMNLIDLRQAA